MHSTSLSLRRAVLRHQPLSKTISTPLHATNLNSISSPSHRALSTSLRQPLHRQPTHPRSLTLRPSPYTQHRHQTRPNSSLTAPTTTSPSESDPPQDLTPAYRITFTCKPCMHRSSHRITKQGYHHGTVLIQCPSCKNRHVITDHLKVFLDQKSTLEDILAKKTSDGTPLTNLIKRGKLGIRQGMMVGNEGEEDVEFWEDGTESKFEKEVEGGGGKEPGKA